jgi:hypothetical protein
MSHLLLSKILDGLAVAKRDGSAYLLSEDAEATAFISLGQEILSIPRLARVEGGGEVVVLTTYRGERFFFPPELVVGLRLGGREAGMPRIGAGFKQL